MAVKNSSKNESGLPTEIIDPVKVFGAKCDFPVKKFAERKDNVPDIDDTYHFDPATTSALLAGFMFNRRVLLQGYHGTGKSTHIEQVAARLNWPCIRINLDSHIARSDLLGRDVIVIQEGQQVTEFREGLLPWALQHPCVLVFDEYDAGRPDVMFVIQRVLESSGKLTLLDQNRVITPHPSFRLFATTNTIGLGDPTGLYHGTQFINQGQMDRWNMVVTLNYLHPDEEKSILLKKAPQLKKAGDGKMLDAMIAMAGLTRHGMIHGDLSTVMSPRTLVTWLENYQIFHDLDYAFRVTFYNKCDEDERPLIEEYYQRCFGQELKP